MEGQGLNRNPEEGVRLLKEFFDSYFNKGANINVDHAMLLKASKYLINDPYSSDIEYKENMEYIKLIKKFINYIIFTLFILIPIFLIYFFSKSNLTFKIRNDSSNYPIFFYIFYQFIYFSIALLILSYYCQECNYDSWASIYAVLVSLSALWLSRRVVASYTSSKSLILNSILSVFLSSIFSILNFENLYSFDGYVFLIYSIINSILVSFSAVFLASLISFSKKNAFDKYGFNEWGIHFKTKKNTDNKGFRKPINNKSYPMYGNSEFNKQGFNYFGYDKDGFNKDGIHKLTYKNYNQDGFSKINNEFIHKDTGTNFNPKGYDYYGFDKDGYDANGYDHTGYDVNGYDSSGYDVNGYDVNGYDNNGYDNEGYNNEGLDDLGYSKEQRHESNMYRSQLRQERYAKDAADHQRSMAILAQDEAKARKEAEARRISENAKIQKQIDSATKNIKTSIAFEQMGLGNSEDNIRRNQAEIARLSAKLKSKN